MAGWTGGMVVAFRLRRLGMIAVLAAVGLCAGTGEILGNNDARNRNRGPGARRLVHHAGQGRDADNAPGKDECAEYAV